MTMQHLIMTALACIAALGLVSLSWPRPKQQLPQCHLCKQEYTVGSELDPADNGNWLCDGCLARVTRRGY